MRNDRAMKWFRLALIGADALCLGAAFLGAALLRGTVDLLPVQPTFDPERYAIVAAGVIPALIVVLWLRGAYSRRYLLAGPEEYARILSGCTYGIVLVVAVSYVYGSLPLVSRGWLLFFWVLAVGLVSTGRFMLRRVAQHLRRQGYFIQRVLIAGANDQGMAIAEQLHSPAGLGVEVIGFLDDYVADGAELGRGASTGRNSVRHRFRVLGHPRDVRYLVAETGADLLIVVPAALSWESQELLVRSVETFRYTVEVRLAPTHYDLNATQVEPAPLGFVPLVRLNPTRLVGVDALLCRCADTVFASLILLVLLFPLLVSLTVAWLQGVWPLVVHRRVLGQGGRPVTLRLLNPRVTTYLPLRGAPALLAVLAGDLALVGPRPVPMHEAEGYRRWSSLLLAVKPGLTGPWRLARTDVPVEEHALLDIWWVRNWSIWQHLFVLVQSLRGVPHDGWGRRDIVRWDPFLRVASCSRLADPEPTVEPYRGRIAPDGQGPQAATPMPTIARR